MAVTNVFETLRERILQSEGLLPAERRAMLWFRNYTTELAQWQRELSGSLTYAKLAARNEAFSKRIVTPRACLPGRFYFFLYMPQGFRDLPYYDRFPFTLVLEKSPGHILGLNFHYLDNLNRARLFDALYTRVRQSAGQRTSSTAPLNSYIAVDYELLDNVRRFRAFRPCIRSYRIDHMRSTMLQVGESEWDLALFLPVEMFKKSTRQAVWSESRKKIV